MSVTLELGSARHAQMLFLKAFRACTNSTPSQSDPGEPYTHVRGVKLLVTLHSIAVVRATKQTANPAKI